MTHNAFKKCFYHTRSYRNEYWIERNYLPEYNSNILHLLGYGESLCHAGCRHSFIHPYWSLQLVVSGQAKVLHDHTESPLTPGNFLLVTPNHEYTISVPPNMELKRRSLLVSNGICMKLLCEQGILRDKKVIPLISPELFQAHYDTIRDCVTSKSSRLTPYDLSIIIYQVIMELLVQTGRQFPVARDFRSFLEDLKENPADIQSVEDMARKMAVSQRTLHRLFLNQLQCTPWHYLLERRLDMAKNLLRLAPEKSVREIALQCGFESTAYFIRQFKKNVGMPPRTFARTTDTE